MGYLGWKNRQTSKTWQEIVRMQDEIIPLVQAESAKGPRGVMNRLAVALDIMFRESMPLQETEDDRYIHDYWGSLLDYSFSEVDWRGIASHLFWQLANPEQHPDARGKGDRKQDWTARDRLWADVPAKGWS